MLVIHRRVVSRTSAAPCRPKDHEIVRVCHQHRARTGGPERTCERLDDETDAYRCSPKAAKPPSLRCPRVDSSRRSSVDSPLVGLFHRRLQPHLDQMQHLPIAAAGRATHRINSECGIVSKYLDKSASTTSVCPSSNGVVDFPNRIERTALGTVAIGRLIEVRFKNRFEHQRKAMGLFGLEPCRRHPPASQT